MGNKIYSAAVTLGNGFGLCQMKLRNAAKARIIRWVKPKSKRKELEAPDFVKEQWAKGQRNAMGDLFAQVNFNQER